MFRFNNKDSVLIPRIFGGLGNQLFIYAAAKRLSLINNIPLQLDIQSGYSKDAYKRHYCLDKFNIKEEIASPRDSFHTLHGERKRYWTRKINSFIPFRYKSYIEQQNPFEERLLSLKISKKVYMQGYWQDERYFKDIEKTIRQAFCFTVPGDQQNFATAQKINSTNAVCVHARRRNYDVLLPIMYYHKAIEYIVERIKAPHFYCFADDPAWYRNLKIKHPYTIIEHNSQQNNYEDLWLMTQCNHFIVANSTFSWWAAWLNANKDKIVVAPEEWGYDTAVPQEWITID